MSKYKQYTSHIVLDDNFNNENANLPLNEKLALIFQETLIGSLKEANRLDYSNITLTTTIDEDDNVVISFIARAKDNN